MASEEWSNAVHRYSGLPQDKKDIANKMYLDRFQAMPERWRLENNCNPLDAALLHEAVNEVLGELQHLTSAADEYEEAMKAIEIMDSLDVK